MSLDFAEEFSKKNSDKMTKAGLDDLVPLCDILRIYFLNMDILKVVKAFKYISLISLKQFLTHVLGCNHDSK